MKTLLHLLLQSLWISLAFGHVLYRWKYIDFDWIDEEHRNKSIAEGKYDEKMVVPIDAYMAKDKVYLGIPRGTGVPAGFVTLNMEKQKGGGPVATPYPDWSWTGTECNKSIISVYRVDHDRCGRLWVMDNGKTGETQTCPPKLLAFDIETRKLLVMKEIPKEYAFNKNGKGLLVTPKVQTYGRRCEKLTMYMADIEGYGLVVWDGKDTFKRFDSPVFSAPKPDFTLNNVSFHLEDGIVNMAFTRDKLNREYLYFTSLASTRIHYVLTKELSVHSSKTPNYVTVPGDVDFRKATLLIKGNYVITCSLEENSLISWDIHTNFSKKNTNTIWHSNEILQFVSSLRFLGPSAVYGLSNKFQKGAAGIRDINEYNYYIFVHKI